jgi:pyridoxamine 5'-phosphate oxidase
MIENPIELFRFWYDEASSCKAINDATEVCLATADKNGRPSARMVLLKKFDDRGFCFFTNYNGRKSKEIFENPFASMVFYWNPLGKQIRIEGRVEKLSKAESDEYFFSRPEGSKIGAWASKQSSELKSRSEFLEALETIKKEFQGKEIPRPDFWGGFRIVPDRIEFWQAEEFRYHRRELFEKLQDGSWTNRLLFP